MLLDQAFRMRGIAHAGDNINRQPESIFRLPLNMQAEKHCPCRDNVNRQPESFSGCFFKQDRIKDKGNLKTYTWFKKNCSMLIVAKKR